MACLKDSTIQAYLGELTPGPLHHTVENHLACCSRCRNTFDRIAQVNRRVQAWLSKLSPPTDASPIDIARARERVLNRIEENVGPLSFRPIPGRPNPNALVLSMIVQAAIITGVLLTGTATVRRTPARAVTLTTLIAPPPVPRTVRPESSRDGGGGQVSSLQHPKGVRVRAFTQPLLTIVRPALTMNPALIEAPDAWSTATGQIGNPLAGIGGRGDGPGGGSGAGPGTGDDAGVVAMGRGISKPELITKADPEYSEEARKAKYSGAVMLSIVVNTDGVPTSIRVVRSLGMGLDEKAIEAVRKWRFKPAMSNGKPVQVRADIEVNFRLL